MYGSTEAGGSGFILVGPAIVGQVDYGEAMVVERSHDYVWMVVIPSQVYTTGTTGEAKRLEQREGTISVGEVSIEISRVIRKKPGPYSYRALDLSGGSV